MEYTCVCGHVYNETDGEPESNIKPGTLWADVPEDYVCPVCGMGKDAFTKG